MDGKMGASAAFKLLYPKSPLILKTTALHTLGLTPAGWKLALRDDLLVAVVRSFLEDSSNPAPIGKQQKMSLKAPAVKGRMWVSRVKMPCPSEDDVRLAVFEAIDRLNDNGGTYTRPALIPVEAEWTGYRPDADKNAPEPPISEEEKYASLLKATNNDTVTLYFHGGAHYLMDPSTHRGSTVLLAKLTQARVLSVRYRLSPQNPFPSALLDALVSYLYLLYPPPGAYHTPIPASKIVFAGDSAGGNLATALALLVRELGSRTISWFGNEVAVPRPAGIATSSPWLDVTRSLPSIEANAGFDYLPPPSRVQDLRFPADDVWPASPPREEMYCDGNMMCHPLVSPLAARDYVGLPPIFFIVGQEGMLDEARAMAGRAAGDGVVVRWEYFEAMPHHFVMVLPRLGQARWAYRQWAGFIGEVTAEGVPGRVVRSMGWETGAKGLERREVEVRDLAPLGDAEVRRLMREAMENKIERFAASRPRDGGAVALPKL